MKTDNNPINKQDLNSKIRNKYNLLHNNNPLSSYSFWRFLLALAVLQTILVEVIQRTSITSAFFWLSSNLLVFLLNIFLVILFNLFFVFLTGSLRSTVIISSFSLCLLSLANLVKKQFLGDPLFPWDFLRLDQVWNLLPEYSGEIPSILLVLGLVTLGLILVGKFLLPRFRAGWGLRIGILVFICILTPLVIFYRHTPLEAALKTVDIQCISWAQNEHSLQNGFLLGFAMNLENLMIFQPEDYSEANIEKIIEENIADIPAVNGGNSRENPSKLVSKPNIVFVLNESFWDPSVMPNLSFSKDPVPYFRELRKNYPSGTMISPVFGGSTANMEFEILTGLSTKFLPQGAIAYQLYIDQKIPAIPSILKANGYRTMAIHPYHDWFYKRNMVYPLLGFEHFYSLKDFPNSQTKGEYIGDLEVSNKIASELEETAEPAFVFAVTMQNHGPYPEDRYDQKELSVSGPLSAQGRGILETYIQGLYDADYALQVLIKQINQLEEPTAIIFLGDHLPYLGKDYLVYRESGYLQGNENTWSLADHLKMKAIPYVIWSNYEADVPLADEISAQFLGNTLLDLAGVQDSFIFNFTRDYAKQLPVNGKTVNMDSDGRTFLELPEPLNRLEDNYRLLQYDILFGEQYYKNYLSE